MSAGRPPFSATKVRRDLDAFDKRAPWTDPRLMDLMPKLRRPGSSLSIVAVDPGTRHMGVCRASVTIGVGMDGPLAIDDLVHHEEGGAYMPGRIHTMARWVENYLHTDPPDLFIIEAGYVSSLNQRTGLELQWCRGALMMAKPPQSALCVMVASEARKAVTGKGTGKKQDWQDFVVREHATELARILRVAEFVSEDQADAIILARAWRTAFKDHIR